MPVALSMTLIVMPAYNEEETVGAVVRETIHALPGVRCLVVDDASNDRTSEVARDAGAQVARVPYNLGVGGAMRVGFRYALDHGYSAVVQIDSDGQHDPSSVPALLAQLDEADVVIGARFAGVGDYRVTGPRWWAMRVLSTFLSSFTGVRLTDSTSGYRATGPRALALFAQHYPAEYLGDTIESLVIAHRAGCRVTQVPVAMRPRAGGTASHDPLKSAVYLGRALVALAFALVSSPRSIVLHDSEKSQAT